VDTQLAAKLQAVGLDPDSFGDPAAAWQRVHDEFGTRATLLDRYALEAAARGIAVDQLADEERGRMALQVVAAHTSGFEVVGGSDRSVRDPVEVVDYDPAWQAVFVVWRERLASALGPTAVRIDHVGSTSVPGLAAKPVIDIQISVPDLDDEASFVPQIEAAGVALRSREVGHRYFRPAGDRPREVQIHVCPADSDWERVHLLYRDYLRAHPQAATAYAEMKRSVAARYRDDRIAYNEAKTDFILDQLARAETWASAAGWTVRST